jgi:hypothetical protein
MSLKRCRIRTDPDIAPDHGIAILALMDVNQS